ncbi:hypothetical protein C8R47DRAFT_1084625 [Mycena vitilis]|nr:hypothetical protein C8R47DRAFT_1084625 [Mycena vitilis]
MEVQVPGLRKPVYDTEDVSNDDEEDDGDGGDYTKINRTTTLRTFLEHAEREDGIVLNALKLPSSNSTQNNPLSGTGLDLEDVAYHQTKGITTFATEALPIEQLYWEIAGTAHTVTLRHYDPTGTRIHVRGPGEKLWPRRRNQDVEDAGAFQDWDPDKPDFSLMQSKEHIVIGLAPEEDGLTPQIDSLKVTLVTGGHFFAASTMRHSLCVHLHLVMMEHVLTNVDADGQWKIFVRICAFWLNVTQNCPHEDRQSLRAYILRLDEDDARGWTDIVCLACVILLATCFDKRHYQTTGVPDIEMLQREQVCKMYKDWRQWFSQNYTGIRDGTQIDWEEDVFSVFYSTTTNAKRYSKAQDMINKRAGRKIGQQVVVLALTAALAPMVALKSGKIFGDHPRFGRVTGSLDLSKSEADGRDHCLGKPNELEYYAPVVILLCLPAQNVP